MRTTPATGAASTGPLRLHKARLASCLAALAVLTGCSGTGIDSTLSTAVQDSSSAVATARLALSLDAAGQLTQAATSTALDDALKELQTSRDTVLRLAPGTPQGRAAVQEALTVLDGCAAGLTTARDAVASDDGQPSLPDGDRELAAAAEQLSRLAAKEGGS